MNEALHHARLIAYIIRRLNISNRGSVAPLATQPHPHPPQQTSSACPGSVPIAQSPTPNNYPAARRHHSSRHPTGIRCDAE